MTHGLPTWGFVQARRTEDFWTAFRVDRFGFGATQFFYLKKTFCFSVAFFGGQNIASFLTLSKQSQTVFLFCNRLQLGKIF